MKRKIRRLLPVLMSGGNAPIIIDFSAQADGALPASLTGATWSIASGLALNTPTLGDELLSDPGLEGTYTDGRCVQLAVNAGTPTLTESADVHGGSKAQSMANTGNGDVLINTPNIAGSAGSWYIGSVWTKRTGGSGNGPQTGISSSAGAIVSIIKNTLSATYAQTKESAIAANTNAMRMTLRQYETGHTVIYDDLSIKAITAPTQFAFLANNALPNATVKAGIHAADLHAGIIARADSRVNPQNYLMALLYVSYPSYSAVTYATLIKVIAGTPSVIVAATSVTFVEDAELEIRQNGSSVSLWYNGTQVGTTQTEAVCAGNVIHGIASAGGACRLINFTVAP